MTPAQTPAPDRKPGFTWGFEVMRRLVEPRFRRRLSRAKWPDNDVTVPACPQEPLSDVLARMTHHRKGLIVIPDATQPEGVLIFRWERR